VGRTRRARTTPSPGFSRIDEARVLLASLGVCPDCPPSEIVRASVFGDGFWPALGLLLLPLGVIALVAVALYGIDRLLAKATPQ
jgi:hypothetical protein